MCAHKLQTVHWNQHPAVRACPVTHCHLLTTSRHTPPQIVKLVTRGRTLAPSSATLKDAAGVESVSKVKRVMVFASAADLAPPRPAPTAAELGFVVIDDLERTRLPRAGAGAGAGAGGDLPDHRRTFERPPDREYGFGAYEALEAFPDPHRAKSMLYRLARDPGIVAIMKKHRMKVGV